MVIFHPPPSGILSTLRLCVSIGLSDDKHSCNGTGEDIIHAYVQLLSVSTPTSNDDSYKNGEKTDKNRAPNSQRAYVTLLAIQKKISHKGRKVLYFLLRDYM